MSDSDSTPEYPQFSRGTTIAIVVAAIAIAAISSSAIPRNKGASAVALDTAGYRKQWNQWREGRAKSAVSPGRPLSYTGLTWLKRGANSIGSDSTSNVRLSGNNVPAKVGTLIRNADSIWFEPAPHVAARVDSTEVSTRVALRSDATRKASQVSIGSAGFRIVKRVDSIGVRAWDAQRPVLQHFSGISHFDLDTQWRIDGHFIPLKSPQRIAVMTESGVAEEHEIAGTIETTIDSKPYALTAFSGGNGSLFITFADASSGEESYGFRFLRTKPDSASGNVVLDFNFAYNPDCAFSPFTTCPLPPPENRIATPLLAGERKLAYERDPR